MAKLPVYKPSRKSPWDARKARHLLDRAGFGGTPAEVEASVRQGFEASVRQLLDDEKVAETIEPPRWLGQSLDLPEIPAGMDGAAPDREQLRMVRQAAQRQNRQRVEDLRAWWLQRMVHTRRPLLEKMTLFWHGHFTTEAKKVRGAQLLYRQNDFLRQNATGSFRTLLLGISRDPAMLRYLDNNTNRREHPNENFARELMELFTMGIGHYTEADVKEAARAFTGWTFGFPDLPAPDGSGPPGGVAGRYLRLLASGQTPEFQFRQRQHDDGEKTFLGRRGNFDGEAAIDIILEQPVTAEFICRKLYAFFVSDEPARPEVISGMADLFRRGHYELKPVLEALFHSQVFYSDEAIANQIKSPAQLVAGALRQLDAEVTPPIMLNLALRQMGQSLLDPPNVKGWDGGKGWINTTTLLARYNFSNMLLTGAPMGRPGRRPGQPGNPQAAERLARRIRTKVDVHALYDPEKQRTPEQIVDHFVALLVSAPLTANQRAELVVFMKKPAEGTGPAPDADEQVKGLIHLIMSTPNYQLC